MRLALSFPPVVSTQQCGLVPACLVCTLRMNGSNVPGCFFGTSAIGSMHLLKLLADAGDGNNFGKFLDMFERRAEKGQCINQPYLGCREFAAGFRLINADGPAVPISETRDLGWMLYDLDFSDRSSPVPKFFKARMENGIVNVPEWNSNEVRG